MILLIMTSIRDSKKKKKKKKKIFRPTYPNFLGHVTGNTHTFLFGLIIHRRENERDLTQSDGKSERQKKKKKATP